MRIKSISIKNYKSFLDDEKLIFESGFNLVIGANNSGKSSVLALLMLGQGHRDPHRSIRTCENQYSVLDPNSIAKVEVIFTPIEVLNALVDQGLYLPLSQESVPVLQNGTLDQDLAPRIRAYVESMQELSVSFDVGSNPTGFDFSAEMFNAQFLTACVKYDNSVMGVYLTKSREGLAVTASAVNWGSLSSLLNFFQSRVYKFDSYRRPVATCPVSDVLVLLPDGNNLPACIANLQISKSQLHETLCSAVHYVYPDIAWIRAPNVGMQNTIYCDPFVPERQRHDLGKPLSAMGTGIGNVISILYVALTSAQPQTIIIDEPNSFLHPRALQALFDVLRTQASHHQYILGAHSAEVINAAEVNSISVLKYENFVTSVLRVSKESLSLITSDLSEIGLRLHDLHAKDRVLWVEGESEVACFPLLLEAAVPHLAKSTAIVRVQSTGDFSKKRMPIEQVVRHYERLATSPGLIPPLVCILLDKESLEDSKVQEISSRTGNRVKFLERRMFENYLFDAKAIAALLNSLGSQVTPRELSTALVTLGLKQADTFSLEKLDGAKIFRNLFEQYAPLGTEFDKVKHCKWLVERILNTNPDHLTPLMSFLKNMF